MSVRGLICLFVSTACQYSIQSEVMQNNALDDPSITLTESSCEPSRPMTHNPYPLYSGVDYWTAMFPSESGVVFLLFGTGMVKICIPNRVTRLAEAERAVPKENNAGR